MHHFFSTSLEGGEGENKKKKQLLGFILSPCAIYFYQSVLFGSWLIRRPRDWNCCLKAEPYLVPRRFLRQEHGPIQ